MRIEIVAIGNELLNGDLADTNTQRFARLLRGLGLAVKGAQTVPDTVPAIVQAFALAAARADVVLVSGGLGPTEDDVTLEAAAAFAGVPLVTHGPTLARIEGLFAARKLPFTPNNARQAAVPEGAEVFVNPVGTAPHVQFVREERADPSSAQRVGRQPDGECEARSVLAHAGSVRFFFFPGVPTELARLADDYLVPWLKQHAPVVAYRSLVYKTFGKTESQVATLLEPLARDPRMHVAYRAHFPEIQVSLHVDEPDAAAAEALLAARGADVRRLLGSIIYSERSDENLVAAVAARLVARGETLALAESCTGGLIAAMCTERAGSSAWFLEGAVTYANQAKTARVGVPLAMIEAHGAVSEAVARAMAEGMRATSGATWALAVTGIAGPAGGSEGKPVGTVHLALAGPPSYGTEHVQRRFPFDREKNRIVSAYSALDMLRRAL